MPQADPLDLDLDQILEALPHREPFVFLHRVSGLVPGVRARGFVTIPADHPYRLGQASVPAGLVLEAMAQLGAGMILYERSGEGALALFRSVEDFVMERQVDFGTRLELKAEIGRVRGRMGDAHVRASVGGEPVASGTLGFAIMSEGAGPLPKRPPGRPTAPRHADSTTPSNLK